MTPHTAPDSYPLLAFFLSGLFALLLWSNLRGLRALRDRSAERYRFGPKRGQQKLPPWLMLNRAISRLLFVLALIEFGYAATAIAIRLYRSTQL